MACPEVGSCVLRKRGEHAVYVCMHARVHARVGVDGKMFTPTPIGAALAALVTRVGEASYEVSGFGCGSSNQAAGGARKCLPEEHLARHGVAARHRAGSACVPKATRG